MTAQSGMSVAEAPVSPLGIGEQLRVEREHRRLSKVWVANHLHLHENMVDALEQEAFERLPAPVFVKGYLRTYAKVLELDEAAIVQPYARSLCAQMQPLACKHVQVKRARMQPSTAGVILLMIALSLTSAWYVMHPRSFDTLQSRNWSALSVANAATTVEPAASVQPSEQAIILAFTADSWVKVRDKDGKKVIRGLMENGTIQALSGRPPFDITLGNSAGVMISQNGRPYDHTPHVRGNVAHFSLGGE